MKTVKLFIIALLFVVVVALPVLVVPVFAATGLPQTEPPALDLTTFVKWLAGSGGSIIAVSWLLERSRKFQTLASETKDYIIFGASVVTSCGALAVITYVPAEVIAAITPYFAIIAGSFVTVFIGKTFHKADKQA